jgi:acetyltransferase-like isoleucine patch superfamily enzyme
VITGQFAFKRFYNPSPGALVVGGYCTLDGVQFAVGVGGRIEIGHHCYMNNTVLLAEVSVEIGNYVMIGWNTTVADADFHPADPALRVEDAIACSPLAEGRKRPPVEKAAVRIEDDVYIGPSVAILKGVRIGRGAFIEPGSVVTRDVPERARILGNPARVIGST